MTRRAPRARPLSVRTVQLIQASAGNRAATGVIIARHVGGNPVTESTPPAADFPAVPPPDTSLAPAPAPADRSGRVAVQCYARPPAAATPKFRSLKDEIRRKQKPLVAHPSPASKAGAAHAAARPPADDRQAQGKVANAEKMNAARPGTFDKAAFITAVNKAISDQAPRNLDEADKFGDSGRADAVKSQVQGRVGQGRDQAAKQIETTTKAAPDTSQAREKPVTPLAPEPAPANPGTPDPAKAVPDRVPSAAIDLSAGPGRVDQQMAAAQVTEEQLARSNEPEFAGALRDKNAGERHAAAAPGQIRAVESRTLADAKAGARAGAAPSIEAMRGQKSAANAAVAKGQQGAQGRDEQRRAQVTAELEAVFDATREGVEAILAGLDKKVDDVFTRGERTAREAFTAEHKRRMDEYKDKRYSGVTGKLRWAKDKFTGLPAEANQIFVTARQGYVARMQTVISAVADVVGGELTRAKQRIAAGRRRLQEKVRELPADLRAIGRQAAGEFAGRFDELTAKVDAKGQELVQTLAGRYNEALKTVDAEIEAEKQKNKGLVARAVEAVKGVVDTILELKSLLLGVLAKAARAVMAILQDPIGFLGHLVTAVGAGLKAFLANIGAHLKKGLIGWLTGSMANAGLQLPDRFDLRGILSMVASLIGLTWGAIRGRIVGRGVPEQAMSAVEAGVPVVAKLRSQGVAGITEEIKDQVGDLKGNLLGRISGYLIPTVLIAGITWVVSLLNPASAFIKACKMIIDFVTFVIERGAQIIAFVNAVLDAVIAIAGGGAGGVPALIEGALARSIPVLIGVLAAILGIGGIATRTKSFFQALAKPVNRAVDRIVGQIVALGKKIWAGLRSKHKGGKGATGPDPKRPDDGRTLKPDWETVNFAADGHAHRLFVVASGGKATLMVASREQPVLGYLDRVIADANAAPELQEKAQTARGLAATAGRQANEIAKLAVHVPREGEAAARQKMSRQQRALAGDQRQLADLLKEIFEEKNSIEPWLGQPVDDVPKRLLGYSVWTDIGTYLYGGRYSFPQIQRAGGFGSADEGSFPMVHVDTGGLVRQGAGILRADMDVITTYRAAIAAHRQKLKDDEAPDLKGSPDGLAKQLEMGGRKQRAFNMGIRKQMEAIVKFLQSPDGTLTGVEVAVGKKRVDYTARVRTDGREQTVMIEYKHVTGNLSAERRTELATKLAAQLTGQISGGAGKYDTHIIDWPEFHGLDGTSQQTFAEVIEDAVELGRQKGVEVKWSRRRP